MKLISMTQKVLEFEREYPCSDKGDYNETNDKVLKNIINHANFLSKQLELGDLVPTDKDGNIIPEPNHLDYKSKNQFDELVFSSESNKMHYHANYDIYQKALDNVIFDGFTYRKNRANHLIELYLNDNFLFTYNSSTECFLITGSTIEGLVKYNLTITPQAIKRFNL